MSNNSVIDSSVVVDADGLVVGCLPARQAPAFRRCACGFSIVASRASMLLELWHEHVRYHVEQSKQRPVDDRASISIEDVLSDTARDEIDEARERADEREKDGEDDGA